MSRSPLPPAYRVRRFLLEKPNATLGEAKTALRVDYASKAFIALYAEAKAEITKLDNAAIRIAPVAAEFWRQFPSGTLGELYHECWKQLRLQPDIDVLASTKPKF